MRLGGERHRRDMEGKFWSLLGSAVNTIVPPRQRVLLVDGTLPAAASHHFRRLFALAGCAMDPSAATGTLKRWARCAAETLHDILCCYRNPHEFFFPVFTGGTGKLIGEERAIVNYDPLRITPCPVVCRF